MAISELDSLRNFKLQLVCLLGIKVGALTRQLEALMATADQLVMPVYVEILKQKEIWICDTGDSMHSIYNKEGMTNERQMGTTSLGHA